MGLSEASLVSERRGPEQWPRDRPSQCLASLRPQQSAWPVQVRRAVSWVTGCWRWAGSAVTAIRSGLLAGKEAIREGSSAVIVRMWGLCEPHLPS